MSSVGVGFGCNNFHFCGLISIFQFHGINWKLGTRLFVFIFTALVFTSCITLIVALLHPFLLKFRKNLYASCQFLPSFKILFTTFVWQQCSFLYPKKKGISQCLFSAILSCLRANHYFIYSSVTAVQWYQNSLGSHLKSRKVI